MRVKAIIGDKSSSEFDVIPFLTLVPCDSKEAWTLSNVKGGSATNAPCRICECPRAHINDFIDGETHRIVRTDARLKEFVELAIEECGKKKAADHAALRSKSVHIDFQVIYHHMGYEFQFVVSITERVYALRRFGSSVLFVDEL
jgi:hypothetical protein